MSRATDDERLWWTFESDFDVAKFGEYEFDERYCGPVAATVGQTSFAWRVALFPNGAKYVKGPVGEVRDYIGVGIQLVGGPVDRLDSVKHTIKVYKADGELEWWGTTKALPMAQDLLRPYLLAEEGVEYVRVQMEVGIPKTAFEPLNLLPPLPTPRLDVAERFSRWSSRNDMVKVVAGDGKQFTIHRGQLTEASDVFNAMLASSASAMKEGRAKCIRMGELCGEALDELISFVTFGATRPSRVRLHVLQLLDVAQRYLLPDLKVLCEAAIVAKMQPKRLPTDLLKLLEAAETYELSVAMDVGLCRLLDAFHQLSDADQDRFFGSDDLASIRKRFMELSIQSRLANKR